MYNFRPRTTYTEQEKKVLEDFYKNEAKKPSEEQKKQLGQQLGKEPNVISVRIDVSFYFLNL